jgi:transcriptional regulator with XRE-family HTH domain
VPTPREQLAEMLKQARIGAGYGSHGALAKRLNVSRPVVTKAENPTHPLPSDAILAAWAGITGAALDVLGPTLRFTPDAWRRLVKQVKQSLLSST